MQSDQSPPESGKIAFRYGLIFGIGLFVIAAILFSLGTFLFFNSDFSIVFSLIYWLIGLVAFFLGGMFAAQKTGKVSTGTIAGLWAGIFDGALYAILAIIVFFTYSLSRLPADTLGTSSSAAGISTETAQQLVVATAVVGQILALLIAIGLGAGIGALGGLVGRATSKVPKQLYPGQPCILDSHILDSHILDSHILDSQILDSHILDSHILDSHILDSQILDSHILDSHILDSHILDSHIPARLNLLNQKIVLCCK